MKNRATSTLVLLTAAALLSVASSGCDRDAVKVYKVDSKESSAAQPAAAPATMPPSMAGDILVPDNSGLPKLNYTLPAGWKEKPLTQLRVASFEISENGKTADVSVIPLGGMAGGDLANVNRWRGQVGLEQVDEAGLKQSAETIEIAGGSGELYDIAGTSPGSGDAMRILGTILHKDDTAWYFKMMGDADLVKDQKASFIAFLKTAELGGLAAPSTMDLSQLPPSHPAIPGMNQATAATTASDSTTTPTWTVPTSWQPGELAQFLTARFVIKGENDASAAVNVSELSGDGGGLTANVNRWRQQLGQPPLTEETIAKLPTLDANGIKAVVAEISGTDPRSGKPASLVGVVLPLNGQTWFYKLMGDSNLVAQQKDALIKFVQSAKYPEGQ